MHTCILVCASVFVYVHVCTIESVHIIFNGHVDKIWEHACTTPQLAHHEEKLMLMEQSLQTTQDQLSQRVTEVVRNEQHNRKLQVISPERLQYRNFRTISRDFFPQLLTLRLKQRMRLIYGFFSIRGASHPRLFLASFQLASKRRAAIRTCLCSVLFISKVSQKFISIFKYSVEWSIHNNF